MNIHFFLIVKRKKHNNTNNKAGMFAQTQKEQFNVTVAVN